MTDTGWGFKKKKRTDPSLHFHVGTMHMLHPLWGDGGDMPHGAMVTISSAAVG